MKRYKKRNGIDQHNHNQLYSEDDYEFTKINNISSEWNVEEYKWKKTNEDLNPSKELRKFFIILFFFLKNNKKLQLIDKELIVNQM
jgi:hypothetical protein